MSTNPSGSLGFADGLLSYQSAAGRTIWRLYAREISVIAAYTTAAGPVADDYFLAFVRPDGTVFEAPVYAEGVDKALKELARELGAGALQPGLANSASWASRVVWPTSLRDAPAFELQQTLPVSLASRVVRAVWPWSGQEAVLSGPVTEYLARGPSAVPG